jgi:hypothetical protein
MYKTLYDKQHRIYKVTTIPDQDNTFIQKGIREKLLCESCEQRLSLWEQYASFIFNGGIELESYKEGGGVYVNEIDYVKFKFFQLSILWRASVSSLDFFRNVHLKTHEEIIRQILLSEAPGTPSRYGCMMYVLTNGSKISANFIMSPEQLKLQAHTVYRFVFGSFMWDFFVSSHKVLPPISNAFLSQTGEAQFLFKDIKEIPSIVHFSNYAYRKGRLN